MKILCNGDSSLLFALFLVLCHKRVMSALDNGKYYAAQAINYEKTGHFAAAKYFYLVSLFKLLLSCLFVYLGSSKSPPRSNQEWISASFVN